MTRTPKVSIVICSYNGSKRIGECLKSLRAQTYPAKKIDIIVIDDGSTDNTGALAKKRGARVVRHDTNKGIPVARNSGLAAAKGDIIAYIDDDCVAHKHWLEALVKPFADDAVVGVGGQIVAYKTQRFSERFMDSVGYGNPAPRSFGKSKHPLRRFIAYVKSMFAPIATASEPVEAQAVYTANVAYRRSALTAIKGFDERLKSDEDADVSTRLIAKGGRLMFAPAATARHRHHEHIGTFIRQTYLRAENTYHYYKKEKKAPPLFPFPFLYVALSAGLAFLHPLAGIACAVFGPLVIYSWWAWRGLRAGKPEQILYSYVQLALESATILGLLRGMVRSQPKTAQPTKKTYALRLATWHIMLCAVVALAAVNTAVYVKDAVPLFSIPIILSGLLFIPGTLLAFVLRLRPRSIADFVAYAFGLGLAFWIIGGLAINWLLPLFGIAEPLRLEPLWITFNASSAILLVAAWWTLRGKHPTLHYTPLSAAEVAAMLVPLGIMATMVAGAQALNGGGEGVLSLLGIGGIAAYIIAVALLRTRIRDSVLAFGLWAIAAALLLMYSLRSNHILGWDIHSELHVFELALEHGYWSMSYFAGEAYNACLSITLFPAVLASFLPIAPEYIFKFVMQLLFAALPAIIFLVSRRYIFTAGAALAGFTFLSQSWFYEQMPALIRQEIALVFFGLALLAVFDASLKRWQQMTLFIVSSCALILSHYSTAYIWLAMLGLALGVGLIARIIRPNIRKRPRHLTWSIFFISVACILVWEGVITQTGGSFTEFAEKSAAHATEAFSPSVIKDGVAQFLFAGEDLDAAQSAQHLQESTATEHANAGEDLYPPQTYQGYQPRPVDYEVNWPATLPEPLNTLVLNLSKVSKLLIINVFTFIGVIVIVWRARKNEQPPHYMYTALCVATLPLIIAILFLPIFQVNYNITRLFTQAFIVLSLATTVGILTSLFFLPRLRVPIAATLLAIFFLFSVGFTERFIGGPARITLQQPSGAFDTYYVHDTEVASARWLRHNRDPNLPLYGDMLAALRLRSYGHSKTTSNDIFPSAISRESYVYMSHANVTRDTTYAQFGNDILMYAYPTDFLDANKDLIYSSGTSKVYK